MAEFPWRKEGDERSRRRKIEQIIQLRAAALSLRIVNRRCQEIREHFEARLLKHPSFVCARADSLLRLSYIII